MSSSATGGALVFNASSFLQRGANGLDILNPTIFKNNLGINTGVLTAGNGLTGAAFNASANSTFAINASQDGATASSSNTFVVQYDLNGNVTANAVTCSNLTLGSFTTSPVIKLGGSATLTGYSGGAGNLLISSTSSGVIGITSPNGSISQSAVNSLEVFATGYKQITTGTRTSVSLYTGSVAPYALTVNSGLYSNGKLNVVGGANVDTLNATTSFITPLANIASLVSNTASFVALTATNATINSVLNAINYITTPTLYTSNAVVIQPPTAFRGTPSALALNDQSISALVKLGISAPSINITSTTSTTANLTQYSTATSALSVVGGLLCSLASTYGAASNALTVTGGAVIDNLNIGTITSTGLCRFPATPSFSYICTTTGGSGVCPLTQACAAVGMDTSSVSSGQIKILTAGRYYVTWEVIGFSGTVSNYLNLCIYRGGGFYSYVFGSVISYPGTFVAYLDLLAGDGLVCNIVGAVTVQRCAISGRFIS